MAAVQNGNGEDEGPLASINIIPFVDIVLVLLIIFMLTSIAIVRASMVVNLPKAATGGARVESTVNIVCNKDGSLLLNGAKTTVEEIGTFVKRESGTNPKLQAVIAADKGVEYGHVVDLIDLVKRNGVSAFALDVERQTTISSP
ncbi:MAG TPA: biopolymer transporter ExbD [Polyangia bacterium]